MKNLGPRLRGDDDTLSPGYVKLNNSGRPFDLTIAMSALDIQDGI